RELPSRGHLTVDGRVEAEVGLALLHKGCPLRLVEPVPIGMRIIEPAEKAAYRIGVYEIAEVVGVEQHQLRQPIDPLIEQMAQREQERFAGFGVVGDVEPETTIGMRE